MDELVQDVVALFNNTHWDKLKKYSNICSVDGSLKTPCVHLQDITFLFKDFNWVATERDSSMYPIQLSVVFMGVKFFSIHSPEEFMP